MKTTIRNLVSFCLLLAGLGPAQALTIVRTNDPSMSNPAIISAADAASASAAFDYAAARISAQFNDPVTINITLAASTDPTILGQSNSTLVGTFTYAQIRAALIAKQAASPTPDGASATAALPAVDPYGGTSFQVARGLAKGLGLIASDAVTDGTITFGTTFTYSYDPLNRAQAGKVDFVGVLHHEITEVMGRVARLNSTGTGNRPFDVFRFVPPTPPGALSTNFTDANVYFSVDGGSTNLKGFNANGNGGDLGDWASGSNDSFNAFSTTGVLNDLTPVDIRVMDVLGWNLAPFNLGPNINVTKSAENNAETFIVVDPTNPLRVFSASTAGNKVFKYSTDGGFTWSNSDISTILGGTSAGDQQAAWDEFGNLFVVYFAGAAKHTVIALSTDGGATFSLLLDSGGFFDQPNVVAAKGEVWFDYTNNGRVARGAVVTGLGVIGAFSAVQTMAGTHGTFGALAIGPTGQVLNVYQTQTGVGPSTIFANLNPTGAGGTFGAQITVTATNVGDFAPITAQPDRTIDSEADLAWDRSGGPRNGRVYLVYTDRPNTSSDDTDIYLRFSDDNGSTWSARLRVNDDTAGNGKSQFMPRIALDQTTGDIAVSFYDCRNSPANNTVQFWAAVSRNGGASFLPNIQVSTGTTSGVASALGAFDLGDYSGLTFHGGVFFPCWADNSNSTGDNPAGVGANTDIYTARVIVASLGTPPVVTLNPVSILVNVGATATFNAAATGTPTPTVQWQVSTNGGANFNDIPGATSLPLSFTASFAQNGNQYHAVFSNGVGSPATTTAATLTVNRPPVANPVGMMRYPTQGVKISIPQLLTNATDPDPGDIVSLLSVGTPANGTTLMASGYVFYTPNAGWLLGDSFTYTVQDNHGAQATSTVTVSIITDNAATNNITKFTKVPGGPAEIDFVGIPGFVYGLQYKLNLGAPAWLDIGPVTINGFGAAHFTDSNPARMAAPQGFYRFIYPAP